MFFLLVLRICSISASSSEIWRLHVAIVSAESSPDDGVGSGGDEDPACEEGLVVGVMARARWVYGAKYFVSSLVSTFYQGQKHAKSSSCLKMDKAGMGIPI